MNRLARSIALTFGLYSAFRVAYMFYPLFWYLPFELEELVLGLLVAGLIGLPFAGQAWCLLLIARGRIPGERLRSSINFWCLVSAPVCSLSTWTYVHNHGAEGVWDAAAVTGLVDESGRFYVWDAPLPRTEFILAIIFPISQVCTMLILWRLKKTLGAASPLPPNHPTPNVPT